MAQLEGSGRGGLGSYNADAYQDLSTFLQEQPMRDGDAWLELLLKKNEMLGEADQHAFTTMLVILASESLKVMKVQHAVSTDPAH